MEKETALLVREKPRLPPLDTRNHEKLLVQGGTHPRRRLLGVTFLAKRKVSKLRAETGCGRGLYVIMRGKKV